MTHHTAKNLPEDRRFLAYNYHLGWLPTKYNEHVGEFEMTSHDGESWYYSISDWQELFIYVPRETPQEIIDYFALIDIEVKFLEPKLNIFKRLFNKLFKK